jgi:hypothetical protein
MDGAEATVEAREASMQLQLDSGSVAVTAEDASIGLTGPQQELVCRGAGYGLGFGYVANFGSPRGLDGVRLEYAVTTACGWPTCTSSSAAPGSASSASAAGVEEPEEKLRDRVVDELYRAASAIARSHDRYAALLNRHPLPFG